MTPETLIAATGCSAANANAWAAPLTAAMFEFGVDQPRRVAGFLAQTAHESGLFVYTAELWGPTASQRGYDNRADLGNTLPAARAYAAAAGMPVGRFYRGRGPIQTTGFTNILQASRALFGDDRLAHAPALLSDPLVGSRAAGLFWKTRGLNAHADADDIVGMTRVINGGVNGLAERVALYARAKAALGA